MRIKFSIAFDDAGDETGMLGEVCFYTPEIADLDQHTEGLAELFGSVFDEHAPSKCQTKVIELRHGVEQDAATGTLVWRVYVRGLVCCQGQAMFLGSAFAACTARFMQYVSEGVKHPPTDLSHYTRNEDDGDDAERIIN